MSNQIEKAYINQFKAGFEQAFQQTMSKLRPFVEVVRQASEFDFYDRVGLADPMQEVTTRYGTNPANEVPHERRRVALRDWDWGKYIDEKDLIRVATDPTSSYMQAAVASANRRVDDIIIPGWTDPAYIGKGGETAVNFVATNSGKITVGAVSNTESRIATAGDYVLTAGNNEGIDVAQNYTATTPANTGITLAKLKAVRTTMQRIEGIDQDTILNCFITAYQANELLGIDEIINSDYAVRKALAEGSVTTFMGYRFIQTERLKKVSTNREVMVTLPRALKLSIGQDIHANMWRVTERKNIPYIYIKLSMGTVRMWGEICARVNCLENA
jgi:hypothetical protein